VGVGVWRVRSVCVVRRGSVCAVRVYVWAQYVVQVRGVVGGGGCGEPVTINANRGETAKRQQTVTGQRNGSLRR